GVLYCVLSDVIIVPSYSVVLTQPPSSTLFPYTTLFRSCPAQQLTKAAFRFEGDELRISKGKGARPFDLAPCMNVARPAGFEPTTDRKSTRLNSSHQIISYAVFCLKKKKKNISIQKHRLE